MSDVFMRGEARTSSAAAVEDNVVSYQLFLQDVHSENGLQEILTACKQLVQPYTQGYIWQVTVPSSQPGSFFFTMYVFLVLNPSR